jgi:hypothetical protein
MHSGPANLSWTSNGQPQQVSGTWAESVYATDPKQRHFIIQYLAQWEEGITPPVMPPLNLQPANAGGSWGPYICLWGTYSEGNKTIGGFISNFNQAPSGHQHVVQNFSMTSNS